MNVLQGDFYSTAFRIRDVKAFQTDPKIAEMRRHMEFFEGERDGVALLCVTSKGGEPRTTLDVRAPAIAGLLEDTRSAVPIDDSQGWIEALRRHLHGDHGIVINETTGDEDFMIYVATDRAGWTRQGA